MQTTADQTELLMSDAPLPAVSFDTRLGEEYRHVDFDYGTYRNMVKQMGGSESDLADLQILISDGGKYKLGTYSTDRIKVNTLTNANRVLAHETKHFVDDKQGVLETYPAYAVSLNRLLSFGAIGALMANVCVFMAEHHLQPDISHIQSALGVGVAATFGAYRFSRSERDAFGAGFSFGEWAIVTSAEK